MKKAQRLANIGAEALIVLEITHSAAFDQLIARTWIPTVANSFFEPDYCHLVIGYGNAATSRKALELFPSMGHQHTAVLHQSTEHYDSTRTLGATFELQRLEVRVPQDMALIGVDDLPSSASAYPSITTIQLPAAEIGIRAAHTVANWVEHQIVP